MLSQFLIMSLKSHAFFRVCTLFSHHILHSFFSFRRCINVGHPWIKLFVVFFFSFFISIRESVCILVAHHSFYIPPICVTKKNWVSSPLNWIKFTLIRISVMDSHVHVHSFNLDFNIYCACTHLLSHTYNYYHPLSSLFFVFNLWFILSHRAIIICRLPPFNAFILDVVCFFFISFFNRSPYAFLFSRSFLSDTMSVY